MPGAAPKPRNASTRLDSAAGIQAIELAFDWPPRLGSAIGSQITIFARRRMTTASVRYVWIILFAMMTASAGSVRIIPFATTIRRQARVEVHRAAILRAAAELTCDAGSQGLPGTRRDCDRRRRRRARHQRIGAAGLALLLGGLVLWLALPRVLASAWLASRDPVIERMDAGKHVAEPELLGLIASRELALSWVEDRGSHDQRATALAELAFRRELRSAAQSAMLERAIGATRAGLAVAPADPRDWMQLGYLLVLLEGDTSREAAEALLLSLRTGAFQAPRFLLRRLFWSLAHWPLYDDEEREQIAGQIRLAWRTAPGKLADLALYVPAFLTPIASALEAAPEARERFVAALAFATPAAIDR